MTTKEFLDRYDSKQGFTEDELYRIYTLNSLYIVFYIIVSIYITISL